MGDKTVQALKHFQVDHSLPVTGYLDSNTLQALGIESSRSIIRRGSAGKRLALVIGNSRYQHKPLKNPVNDAEDMANVLQDLNFQVIKKINTTRRGMVDAITEFGGKLHTAQIGLFFYAGHGMQINGVNYLLPIDARCASEADVEFEAVRADRLLAQMQQAKNKLNIVVLDACRDNPFRSFRSTRAGLAEMHAPKGSIVAYATAPGSVAEDGKGKNGLFTSHLLKYLQKSGLTVQQVFQQTGLSVMAASSEKQVPWVSSTPIPDFYLASVGQSHLSPSPSATPGPDFPPKTTGLGNMDDVIRKREDARAKWSQWQSRMEADYANAQRYEQSTALNATEKKAVWEKFNNVWSAENPYSTQDEIMRAKAGERVQYWQSQATVAMSRPPRTTPSASPGRTWTEPTTGMEFVWVTGGCYQMGDTFGEGHSSEKPVHLVCVDGFWLGKTEVTQGQWTKIMGSNPSNFKKGDNYPVEQVTWNDSQTFIEKLNSRSGKRFRLPYEAEWEYAAREGGKKVRFGTGKNTIGPGEANYKDRGHTVPVDNFLPNSLGLYNMTGNVGEWCEDWYEKDYYRNSPRDNPRGPPSGSYRVYRGGSWYAWKDNPWVVRAAHRLTDGPGIIYGSDIGFRLALPSGQ